MDFRFRENEINEIDRLRWLADEQHTRVLLVTGQPLVGKKTLIRKALNGQTLLYFVMGPKSEPILCREFFDQARHVLSLDSNESVTTFSRLFEILFEYSVEHSFTLVIDEFHRLPEATLSHLSDFIQSRKRKTSVNIVLVSSDELMAENLSVPEDSVLYNCIDSMIPLKPFTPSELKAIFFEKYPTASMEDFMLYYCVTGGLPFLVWELEDSTDFLSDVFKVRSSFLNVGSRVLEPRLGKNGEIYYSILQAISCGASSQSEIESYVGCGQNVGGHLAKLESVYNLIERSRPAFSSEKSRGVVRYRIKSQYLDFWFRWIETYRSDIDSGNFDHVRSLFEKGKKEYLKSVLVRYFREKLSLEGSFSSVEGWWLPVSDQSGCIEIPVVAANRSAKTALAAQVVLAEEDFDKDAFLKAVSRLKGSIPRSWSVNPVLFKLSDC